MGGYFTKSVASIPRIVTSVGKGVVTHTPPHKKAQIINDQKQGYSAYFVFIEPAQYS